MKIAISAANSFNKKIEKYFSFVSDTMCAELFFIKKVFYIF